jgi:hypothetical protein
MPERPHRGAQAKNIIQMGVIANLNEVEVKQSPPPKLNLKKDLLKLSTTREGLELIY